MTAIRRGARLGLDRLHDLGEERVGDVGDGDPDGRVATAAEGHGQHVGHVVQVASGRLDALADALGDVVVAPQDARDRLGAHPGPLGHVAHRGHAHPPGLRSLGRRRGEPARGRTAQRYDDPLSQEVGGQQGVGLEVRDQRRLIVRTRRARRVGSRGPGRPRLGEVSRRGPRSHPARRLVGGHPQPDQRRLAPGGLDPAPQRHPRPGVTTLGGEGGDRHDPEPDPHVVEHQVDEGRVARLARERDQGRVVEVVGADQAPTTCVIGRVAVSRSRRAAARRWASTAPTVDLPEPGGPHTSSTAGRGRGGRGELVVSGGVGTSGT